MRTEGEQRLDDAFVDFFRISPDHADVEIQNGAVVGRELGVVTGLTAVMPEKIGQQGVQIYTILLVRSLRKTQDRGRIVLLEDLFQKAVVDADASRGRFP